MKKFLLMMLGVLLSLPVLARDFSYAYEGQTLNYTVIDEEAKTCMTKAGDYGEYSVYNAGNEVSGDLVIPSRVSDGKAIYTVTSIGEYAFYECSGLTSVTITEGVTSIGEEAFYECSGLTSVTIPESVTSIGEGAFEYCSGLKKAEFASIEALCKISFKYGYANPLSYANNLYINGEKITDLVIPAGVTSIGGYAFSCCFGLTSVTIPKGVTSIGDSAFYACFGLTSVTTPEGVTSIGEYAFANCFGLTSVTILEGETSIGDFAFFNCRGLTSVTIPEGVTSIGIYAFSVCSGLTSVYYGADQPISADYSVFDEETYDKATLYLSEEGVVYSSMINPWKNFKTIEAYKPSGIDDILTDSDEDAPCEIYDLRGVKAGDNIKSLTPGLYIIRKGKTVKKIAVK